MLKQACGLCKVVGAIAILGLLNLGVWGITQVNYAAQILGSIHGATRAFDVLCGLAGVALLVSFFTVCPACKTAGKKA